MEAKFKVEVELTQHYDEYEREYVSIKNVVPESLSLKCPHCSVYSIMQIEVFVVGHTAWHFAMICKCAHCKQTVFVEAVYTEFWGEEEASESTTIISVYPSNNHVTVPEEIPETYSNDYREAILIQDISPQASAALSRRILQTVLREEFNITARSLEREIEQFIHLKNVPSYLTKAIDAIRVVGNLAAHPMKDTNSEAIVTVEPGEAEWLLEILHLLLDFTFVQPKQLDERKKTLNAKLQSLGKPPLK